MRYEKLVLHNHLSRSFMHKGLRSTFLSIVLQAEHAAGYKPSPMDMGKPADTPPPAPSETDAHEPMATSLNKILKENRTELPGETPPSSVVT
jgi:hypothetical protein